MSSCSSIFSKLDTTKSSSSSSVSVTPLVGSTVVVKALKIHLSLLSSDSILGSVSLKVVTRALLFPIVLRYVGHSCFMCPKP